eukprot:CAMPEP_0181357940 /NCGR_PEP_ID=MMETSP1106-20121128/5236_1 /TAXON_ID=81844 /ORGANISM="Mantoniella antarctica, Strain SL-175" /LENGTH=142 /DNA_ID=CAMNT_0023470851 /DNA_START=303 /DNA_END=731 /DNA_ORIENTATION=-
MAGHIDARPVRAFVFFHESSLSQWRGHHLHLDAAADIGDDTLQRRIQVVSCCRLHGSVFGRCAVDALPCLERFVGGAVDMHRVFTGGCLGWIEAGGDGDIEDIAVAVHPQPPVFHHEVVDAQLCRGRQTGSVDTCKGLGFQF